MIRASIAALALLALTACGGNGGESGGGGSGGGDSATATADSLKSEISSISKTVEITEDNDPNGDIGRPGKYTEAVSIYDDRAECDSELDVTCGAKIEVWDDEDAAKERSEYIQGLLEDMPMLGSEYHYIDGGMLLRVSGQLKPTEAEEYEGAF
jgi:hypothetical protein